jgi:hypothetical protein
VGGWIASRTFVGAFANDAPTLDEDEPSQKRPCKGVPPLDLLDGDLGASTTERRSNESVVDEWPGICTKPTSHNNSVRLLGGKPTSAAIRKWLELLVRYLSAPSTSVPNERFVNSPGDVYSDSRSRLMPERAEMLLLIKKNKLNLIIIISICLFSLIN